MVASIIVVDKKIEAEITGGPTKKVKIDPNAPYLCGSNKKYCENPARKKKMFFPSRTYV